MFNHDPFSLLRGAGGRKPDSLIRHPYAIFEIPPEGTESGFPTPYEMTLPIYKLLWAGTDKGQILDASTIIDDQKVYHYGKDTLPPGEKVVAAQVLGDAWLIICEDRQGHVYVTSRVKGAEGFYPGLFQAYDLVGKTWETLFPVHVVDANE